MTEPQPFGSIAKAFVLSMIECCADPAERKARIMIACQHGHITAEEAEEYIVLQGLEAA